MPNLRNRFPARRRFLKQSAALTASASLTASAPLAAPAVLTARPTAADPSRALPAGTVAVLVDVPAAVRAVANRFGSALAGALGAPVRLLEPRAVADPPEAPQLRVSWRPSPSAAPRALTQRRQVRGRQRADAPTTTGSWEAIAAAPLAGGEILLCAAAGAAPALRAAARGAASVLRA